MNKHFARRKRLAIPMLCALLPASTAAQALWTRPLPIHGLAGAGDVVAAATAGGVVLWDTSSDRSQIGTTAHGLPTHVVLAASIPPDRDELCVATTNGLARGWFRGAWRSVGARNDERGLATFATMSLDRGRSFAGGTGGLLLRWNDTDVDSLRLPSPAGRIVSLTLFTTWLQRLAHRPRQATLQHDGESLFPVGLVAAVDNDGVWLLRSSGSRLRWLRFVQEDGLPSHRPRCVVTDSQGRLWVATDRGIAWIDGDLNVHSLANDPLGAQRTHVLLEGLDGFLYAGTESGLFRIDLAAPLSGIERLGSIQGPIVALAQTDTALWFSDGWTIANLAGERLHVPAGLNDNYGLSLYERDALLWIGHPSGRISLGDESGWLHLDTTNGLPADDITHFLAIRDRVYVGTAASGLFATISGSRNAQEELRKVAPSRFFPVPGSPASSTTQAVARGSHWVGGKTGLHVRRDALWESFPLWAGATEIVDLCGAGDTLWASAAHAGVAFHDGQGWSVPGRPAGFELAFCGRMHRHDDGRIAVATDRGLLIGSGGTLHCDARSPDAFLTDVVWWRDCIACGTHRGLVVRDATGAWDTLGVRDGLPGARVRALHVDSHGHLWLASTRGLGRVDPGFCRAPEISPWQRSDAPDDVDSFRVTRLDVFDVRGRIVQRFDGIHGLESFLSGPGGRRLAAGIYFVRSESSRGVRSTRLVLLR